MFGTKEQSIIFDIIKRNDMLGERIHFDNACFHDENENRKDILWIETPKYATTYSEIYVCIDDVKEKLFGKRMAITIVYLRLQQIEREFNA